jgi:hypothetical protein
MRGAIAGLLFMLLAAGCSHPLEVRNIHQYKPTHQVFAKNLTLGVNTPNTPTDGKALVDGTVQNLNFYTGKIFYPAMAGYPCDVLCRIIVTSRHKGNPNNFFINFPGFLVWAPAWHGYIYKTGYDIVVDLTTPAGDRIDSFTLPVDLDVRHAGMNRTWTELSWLEFGVLAFAGGVVFTQYDPAVTSLVETDTKRHIGGYIAQEIMTRIAHLQPAVPLEQPVALPLNGRQAPRTKRGLTSLGGGLHD